MSTEPVGVPAYTFSVPAVGGAETLAVPLCSEHKEEAKDLGKREFERKHAVDLKAAAIYFLEQN